MKSFWIIDPKTDKKSVTLTLLIASFILLIAGGIGMIYGKTSTVGPLLEIYIANTFLYFGRRTNLKTKSFTLATEEEKEEKK